MISYISWHYSISIFLKPAYIAKILSVWKQFILRVHSEGLFKASRFDIHDLPLNVYKFPFLDISSRGITEYMCSFPFCICVITDSTPIALSSPFSSMTIVISYSSPAFIVSLSPFPVSIDFISMSFHFEATSFFHVVMYWVDLCL